MAPPRLCHIPKALKKRDMKRPRNAFDLLGVTPADDMTTIRMAWRAKVRRLHPDVFRDRVDATERLAEVNAAFDALQGHVPDAKAVAAREAEAAWIAEEAEKRAKVLARLRVKARRRAEKRARDAKQARDARALAEAKAKAAKARLKVDMGTINARAVQGYTQARKVVSVLQK